MKKIFSFVIFSVIIFTSLFSTNVFASSTFERVEDNLVILVQFTEDPNIFATTYKDTGYSGYVKESDSYYSDLFFNLANNNVYSVRNYLRQQSGGKLDLPPALETSGTANDGVIRVTLDIPHPNVYKTSGDDAGSLTDTARRSITKEAMNKAAPYINFPYYDKNSDEKLTIDELKINLVLASGDEYKTPGTRAFFSPDALLVPASNLPVMIDGVNMKDMGMIFVNSSKYYGESTLGIYCHELSHSLGAKDLYRIPNNNIKNESIMVDSYSFPPPSLDPFNKMIMGFVSPTIVSSSGTYTVNSSLPDNPGIYDVLLVPMISGETTQEYLLIENRQFNGFDTILRKNNLKGGVAIWHVSKPLSEKFDYPNIGNLRLEKGIYGSLYNNEYDDTLDITSSFSTSKNFYNEASGVSVKVISTSSSSMNVEIKMREELKNLKVTLNGIYTTFSWDAMSGATEYEISRDTEPYVNVGSSTRQCYTATCGNHVYRVRAKDASGEIIGISKFLQFNIQYFNNFDNSTLNFIRLYLNGSSTPNISTILDYDVNGDSQITNEDYILIEKYINNQITRFPVGVSKLIVYGDTNEDGMVTAADSLRVMFNYFENIAQKVCADLDNNGVIDSRDLTILENYINNGPDLFSHTKGMFPVCLPYYSDK
ncbi:dockerin type I domain-containing protein [Acetivibrio cellulolyticus]|uniref:dockerin type I domain-containing protein n=1 Tax=Acetivibrio cellulolyticus TaxID=35830 RepID=UPI0001E2F5F0|nr:dockerin type I domain-containing protein [Acetivibrio cellulolyticus]